VRWIRGLGPASDGNAASGRWHHTRGELWSSIPRENGSMHDQLVHSDFFSSADSTAVSTENRPIDAPQLVVDGTPQLPEQNHLRRLPNSGGLPAAQPAPTGHAASTVHFLRQHFPRNARPDYEQDSGQRGSIVNGRATALRPRRVMWQQQWFDARPQLVRNRWRCHNRFPSSRSSFFSTK